MTEKDVILITDQLEDIVRELTVQTRIAEALEEIAYTLNDINKKMN